MLKCLNFKSLLLISKLINIISKLIAESKTKKKIVYVLFVYRSSCIPIRNSGDDDETFILFHLPKKFFTSAIEWTVGPLLLGSPILLSLFLIAFSLVNEHVLVKHWIKTSCTCTNGSIS